MAILEKTANVTVIAVCLVSLGLLAERRLIQDRVSSPAAEAARAVVGRSLRVPGASWTGVPITLVLQISSSCHFCQESTPFYKNLAASKKPGGAGLVVATADAQKGMQAFLASEQVAIDTVLHTTQENMLIKSTPVIFAVDSNGKVRKAFVGKLDSSGERRVLSILETGKVEP